MPVRFPILVLFEIYNRASFNLWTCTAGSGGKCQYLGPRGPLQGGMSQDRLLLVPAEHLYPASSSSSASPPSSAHSSISASRRAPGVHVLVGGDKWRPAAFPNSLLPSPNETSRIRIDFVKDSDYRDVRRRGSEHVDLTADSAASGSLVDEKRCRIIFGKNGAVAAGRETTSVDVVDDDCLYEVLDHEK